MPQGAKTGHVHEHQIVQKYTTFCLSVAENTVFMYILK